MSSVVFAEGRVVGPISVDQPASSIVRKHRFDVGDGRHPKQTSPQRGGMWESLTVPTQMFSHSSELIRAPLHLEVASVGEKNFEPPGQRRRPRNRIPRLSGPCMATGFFLAVEEPWRSQRRTPDQDPVDAGLPDTTHDLT